MKILKSMKQKLIKLIQTLFIRDKQRMSKENTDENQSERIKLIKAFLIGREKKNNKLNNLLINPKKIFLLQTLVNFKTSV